MYGGGVNPHDVFLSLDAALEVAVKSKKPEAVELVKWLAEKGVEKVVEDKQKALQAIEDKDNALTLLNDDLNESQQNIVILEQDNLELQRRNEILRHRAVPYLRDYKKNNAMVFIKKNNNDEYNYVAICGQQDYVAKKLDINCLISKMVKL